MAGTSPAMTKINLNGFSGCYCHGIRVQFKPEPFSLHLSPLAGRGRSRSAAKASGEGDSPRTRTRGGSPSPGSHLTMRSGLSPQAGRGDITLASVRMTDYLDINRRNWDERAAIHARDATGDYMLDRFRAGEDALHAIEAAELGDISGKRVLHLQCHIGRDTLCLVRRGAIVTGLDFSGAALNVARRLSAETGLKADFVEGTVDQAPHLAPGPFDLVFTTWGTICWLPDVSKWAKVIASVLRPGGELYFADAHPGFS